MLGIEQITRQTVDEVAKSILDGTQSGKLSISKAIDTTTGLKGVNLEAPAKQLVPLMSPFRQSISRTVRDGSTTSDWRAITSLSTPKLSVAETNAGAAFTTTVVSKSATYKIMALRGQVTREAVAVSQGFDPALAKETANTLLLAMKLEEQYMLGGNVTALGTPAAPTCADQASPVAVGSTTATWYFAIAALTLPAMNRLTVNRPADYNGTDAAIAGVAIPTIDVGTDGCTVISATTSLAMTATHSAKITWTAVPGAAGYVVFAGTTNSAAGVLAQCVVTQTSVTLTNFVTAASATGASMAGNSADAQSYDGIIPQLFAAGSGAYIKTLAAKLSQSNGEIVEFQDAFTALWDQAKIGKFRILVSGQEQRTLTKLGVVAGAGPSLYVDPTNTGVRSSLVQGYSIGAVINSVTGDVCPLETLPWLPGGMALILPTSIPYPDANAVGPFDMAMGYDWERWDYASTTANGSARIYPFEVVCYGVIRAIFTGGCGVIYNIFKG